MKTLYILLLTSALLFSVYGCKKEDTSVSGDTNNFPSMPHNPSPSDSATGIDDSSNVILSWVSSDPDIHDTLKFDVFAGSTLPLSNVPLAADLAAATYNMGVLTFPGTTYYWQVRARDNHGATSTGEIWQFTIRTRP